MRIARPPQGTTMPARYSIPIEDAEEIIPRLARGIDHWKKNFSAYELAHAWFQRDGFPPLVREALNCCEHTRDAELLEGIFERQTDLGSRGSSSQTDLLCLARTHDARFIVAVEGKVAEGFGETVATWLKANTRTDVGRRHRLKGLLKTFGNCITESVLPGLRYQLLHRTASAIYEARRFGCQ
jgi:hypothetical protein